MKKRIIKCLYYFLVFSFFGWCWEVFVYFLTDNRFVNAGTLIGPWLPIYGSSIVLAIIISKRVKSPIYLFLIYFLLTGIIEYITSLYLEVVYHARWWDYSGFLFNFNGRTSLEIMLFFSIIGGVCVNYIVPILDNFYKKINNKLINFIIILLSLVFIFDFVYSTFNPNIM